MSKSLARVLSIATLAALLPADAPTPIKTGPPVGAAIPGFSAPDQFGAIQTSRSILGPKGALLVFFRSADW